MLCVTIAFIVIGISILTDSFYCEQIN